MTNRQTPTVDVNAIEAMFSMSDPMERQMQIIASAKSKLMYPAPIIENDDLAIQLSNAMALKQISTELADIRSSLSGINRSLTIISDKPNEIGELTRAVSNAFNMMCQILTNAVGSLKKDEV